MAKNNKKRNIDVSDVLMDDLDRFEYIVTSYWKQIVYACVAVVAAVIIGSIVVSMRQASKIKAESAIANAKTIESLRAAISKYPDYDAAKSGKLRLSMMYIAKKEYENARKCLSELAKNATGELGWRAQLNTGYLLELEGKKEDAAKHFELIGSNSANPPSVRTEANYSAGRIFSELKDEAKAKSLLTMSIEEGRKTSDLDFWKDQSQTLLDRLNVGGTSVAPSTKSDENKEKSKKKLSSASK